MEQPQQDKPVAYEPPKVVDYGSLTDITAASATGAFTDRAFPSHTPVPDVSISS